MNDQSPTEPLASPGIASAEGGHVVLDGPNGFAITLTVDAAAKTAESLFAAVEEARKQK